MATKVAVIGAGGMGSWFARFFRSQGYSVIVSDRDQARARRLASRIGAAPVSDNVEAARGSDIIVLAAPVNVVSEVVREITPALRKNALLIDISAVKSAVLPSLRSVERRGVKVASIHPMFGPLATGLRGRSIIVVRTRRDQRVAKMVKRMFPEANIILADPEVHDRQVAVTLALPHFINMVFASVISSRRAGIPKLRQFAGRTFDLQMLLAETIASEPETAADIQILNKAFPAILRELERHVRSLTRILNSRDRSKLVARYRQIGELLSTDPEFRVARRKFEKACEVSSRISKA